jgi:hypothetical protein
MKSQVKNKKQGSKEAKEQPGGLFAFQRQEQHGEEFVKHCLISAACCSQAQAICISL